MGMTIDHTTTVTVIPCAGCGAPFGVQSHYLKMLRANGETFYCPKGCYNVYRTSTADKLEAELASVKRDLEYQQEQNRRNRQDAEHFKKSRDAYKGQVTKIKRRVVNGVCPCCNRTFQNLREHMQSQHPDFEDASE